MEYETLLLPLRQLRLLEVKKLLIHNNSHLVVNQVNNVFEEKEE